MSDFISGRLKERGLDQKSINIYSHCLTHGEFCASDIEKLFRLSNKETVKMINQLVEHQLLLRKQFGKEERFLADVPDFLFGSCPFPCELGKYRDDMKKYLPEFFSIYYFSKKTPKITMYKGKQGLQKIRQDFLTNGIGRIITSIANRDDVDKVFTNEENLKYREQRCLRNMFSKSILYRNSHKIKLINEKYSCCKNFQINGWPIHSDITLYSKNKIAIASLKDQLFGIIIENRECYELLNEYFSLVYDTESLESLWGLEEPSSSSQSEFIRERMCRWNAVLLKEYYDIQSSHFVLIDPKSGFLRTVFSTDFRKLIIPPNDDIILYFELGHHYHAFQKSDSEIGQQSTGSCETIFHKKAQQRVGAFGYDYSFPIECEAQLLGLLFVKVAKDMDQEAFKKCQKYVQNIGAGLMPLYIKDQNIIFSTKGVA